MQALPNGARQAVKPLEVVALVPWRTGSNPGIGDCLSLSSKVCALFLNFIWAYKIIVNHGHCAPKREWPKEVPENMLRKANPCPSGSIRSRFVLCAHVLDWDEWRHAIDENAALPC